MGRGLEGVVFHQPEKKDGLAMRWDGRQVSQVGTGDLETVQEAVEPAYISLVTNQRLGGPGGGGVNHLHPLQHHEGI
jgi:hypothetical protein